MNLFSRITFPVYVAGLIGLITVGVSSLPCAAEETNEVREFTIQVDKSILLDLQRRLELTRWPDQISGTDWQYGVPLDYMKKLVEHWRTNYDWRKQEREFNRFAQYTTRIDGIDVHFLNVRSAHENAKPLILVHGWPGSVYEFHKIIPMLTNPEKYGGKAADAFHVVCPSLLGFGFSGVPEEPGWNSRCMAEVFAKLMARLKYDQYVAQGGDWGSGIVRWLADNDGAHCVGAHSNMPPGGAPREDPMRDVTQEERDRMQQRREEISEQMAYYSVQSTRPLTLGYGLNDSPAGLAAWVVDKFWAWSDHGGDLESSFSKDEMITNVMFYWVTNSMPSAARIYYESRHNQPRPSTMTPFKSSDRRSPLGFALFPKEINVPPRAWVKRNVGSRMAHWSEMPRGGHFAAMEAPDLLAEDIRKFSQTVSK